jgi:Bacterial Ig-like domain/FG-GAP repeat
MSQAFTRVRVLAVIAAISCAALWATPFGCGGSSGPAPTVTLKLVRLDLQELDLSAKPIPVTVSIKATFSAAMDPTSVEGAMALVDGEGAAVAGTFAWNADNTQVTFAPTRKLHTRTTYHVRLSDAAESASKAAIAAVDQPFVTMTAGDIDGDGTPDIVVGSMWEKGTVSVYSGAGLGASPITPIATIAGENIFDGFGQLVVMAGDVDADGYTDIAAGAPSYRVSGLNGAGAAYFFSGRKLFGIQPVSLTVSDADAVLFGREQELFVFANSISGGFDVDGDGYDDLIIGEPANPSALVPAPGEVFVFSGKTLAGSKKAADAELVLVGDLQGCFGTAVGGIKDLDGDGKDDIVVGASCASPKGAAYVFRARDLTVSTGLASAAAVIKPSATVVMMIFANLVSAAGDMNGDGIDEILIGNVQEVTWPALYVFSGKDIPASGTIDLDETQSIAAYHDLSGGVTNNIAFGGVGDIDEDRRDDIVIGAQLADDGGSLDVGEILIEGLDATGVQKPSVEIKISGAPSHYYFGRTVSGIGDIDGDDVPDIAASAMTDGMNPTGFVYIFSGKTIADTTLSDAPEYTIEVSALDPYGLSLAGAFR